MSGWYCAAILRIALRAQVPDRSRVLDQKRKVMPIEQRQHARGVGADQVAHARVEAIVYMRQHKIQIRLGGADGFDLADPFLLLPARQLGAIIEKRRAAAPCPACRIETVPAGRSRATCEIPRARRRSCGVKRAGLAAPSSDSKYSSARFTPSQSKRRSARSRPSTPRQSSPRLVRFISLRQSSCASCNSAVFSRHSG